MITACIILGLLGAAVYQTVKSIRKASTKRKEIKEREAEFQAALLRATEQLGRDQEL